MGGKEVEHHWERGKVELGKGVGIPLRKGVEVQEGMVYDAE